MPTFIHLTPWTKDSTSELVNLDNIVFVKSDDPGITVFFNVPDSSTTNPFKATYKESLGEFEDLISQSRPSI